MSDAETTTVPWVPLAEPVRVTTPMDPDAIALAQLLGVFIKMGASLDSRNAQAQLGISDVGGDCERKNAYKMSGTPRTNDNNDPLRALIGRGVHMALADVFSTLDPRQNWFRVEHHVSYRGVPGTTDLVYILGKTVIDWKTTRKNKITRIRKDGPSTQYIRQINLYACGLREQGYDIQNVAIVYVPVDLDANDGLELLHVWRSRVDQSIADDAVERMTRLSGALPADVTATPSALCRWCAHYHPATTDLNAGCPGNSKGATE